MKALLKIFTKIDFHKNIKQNNIHFNIDNNKKCYLNTKSEC